ncbi:MAG: S8 family serine peptidase, partial [Thermomicrobiales bacterium]
GSPTTQPVAVTVEFYRTANTAASVASLLALGGTVFHPAHDAGNLVDISLDVPGNQLVAIANRADVFNVEPFTTPGKRDEVQDQIVAGNVTAAGGNIVPTGPGYRAWLASKGFSTVPADYPIIDVVDDGIDNGTTSPLHPDFYQLGSKSNPSRLIFNNNCTTDLKADGQAGHGNLNVGIVGAYNDKSGYPYIDGNGYDIGLGVSPYGRIAGTKIFQNGAGTFDESACGGTDQGTVLAAYTAGARITSNSWGANTAGAYDAEARAYDILTRDATNANSAGHEMLHVFSAGNSGPTAQSVGSPGTAKNVLTVGATDNVRDNGVIDGCATTEAISADNIIGFSSRGPTADGRLKPDVVAPGTHVQGPASQDPTYDGTGVCGTPLSKYYPNSPPQTLYTWSSGTSHSAPAVSGVASLVYNYYGRVISPGHTPTPAMLKALILNAPRYLTGISANDTLPSPNQGWGDANLGALFDSSVSRAVFDEDPSRTFTATGNTFVKGGTVANSAKPFRVTLAWTDAPGSTTGNAFVNDLNLEVTVGGQVYRGNHFSGQYSTPGGAADTRDNVESVFLPAGTSGPFSVRVVAANLAAKAVPTGPGATNQDFALVVTNAAVSPTAAIGVASVTALDSGPGTNGNGNGIVEPGETIALSVGLVNNGDLAATGVSGTLATTTPGITITNATSAYPNLPAATSGTPTPIINTTPFIFTVSASFACGTPIAFTETVHYGAGLSLALTFTIPVGAPSLTAPVTYTSTDVPKPIPDNDPVGITSNAPTVSGAGTVGKLTVKINITHTFDSDLIIKLVAPNSTAITLSNQNGSGGHNYTDTVFDDAATTSIVDGIAPFTGSFRPEMPLSTFIGMPVAGTWKLFVSDNFAMDTGTLNTWSLNIQQPTVTCLPFTPLSLDTIQPSSGPTSGGTLVTLKGHGFSGTPTVTFGGIPATNVTLVDVNTITAVTPPHAASAVDVVLTMNSTVLSLGRGFTYGIVNVAPVGPSPLTTPIPVPSQRPGPTVVGTPNPAPSHPVEPTVPGRPSNPAPTALPVISPDPIVPKR